MHRPHHTAAAALAGILMSLSMSHPVLAGGPIDWSHRHVIYSNPETRESAAARGWDALLKWHRLQADPRFLSALARKEAAHARRNARVAPWFNLSLKKKPVDPGDAGAERDWSYFMGFSAGAASTGQFPAKYSFDINATPSCPNDFIAFATNAAGVAFVNGVAGTKSGTFTGQPNNNQSVTLQSDRPNIVFRSSTTVNTGLNFLIGANTTATAANLAAAINRFGTSIGVVASSSGATVTVTAIGPGNSAIAVTEGLANFTWTGGNGALAGATGTAGQATILSFNQLYSSCGATFPAAFWSYNTGTGAIANGSPTLSLDGSQVAFIQTAGAGGAASLVVLKWMASDGGVVTPTTLASSGTYLGCTAPCMKSVALSGGATNSNSDPYYDYANDVLYVGDDAGVLHKFSGVFNGEPAEVATAPWPVTVSAGNKLSSPVLDFTTGVLFLGSSASAATGGQLHSFNPATSTLVASARLSTTTSGGVADSPIIDSSAGKVYAFVGSDIAPRNATFCSASPCMAIYQFDMAFAGGTLGSKQQVGRGRDLVATRQLLTGSFDEAYYASADPANPSGSLYVCAGQQNTAQRPTLWKVQVTNNAWAGATEGPRLNTGNGDCSPVTLVTNGASEFLYASVTNNGNIGVCSGACLYMYDLNALTSAWGNATLPNAELAAPGGTGGIIVDNISANAGASQIYYGTITSPGNAIQASQAGLQ